MPVAGANAQITAEVLSWPQTSAAPHRFGGVEYRLGTREIGHIHGDNWVDIPFPTAVRHALIAAGQAEAHHLLRDSGWITFYLRQPADIAHAVALLRRSYDIAQSQLARRLGHAAPTAAQTNTQTEVQIGDEPEETDGNH